MGFTFEVLGPQKARLLAGQPGDNRATFVEVVRQSLGQRITSFEVDVSKEPQCLEQIKEPLLKLLQLVKSRGQNVEIIGIVPGSPQWLDLNQAGFVMKDAVTAPKSPEPPRPNPAVVPKAAPSPAAPQPSPSGVEIPVQRQELLTPELKDLFAKLDTDLKGEIELPPPERVIPYMQAVQNRLMDLLKREESLKAEEATLGKRLQFLKKHEPGGRSNLEEYNVLLKEEEKTLQLRNTVSILKKKLVEAKEEAQNQEKAHREFVTRLDAENRKKLEALKRESETLKSNIKKVQEELNKPSSGQGTPT